MRDITITVSATGFSTDEAATVLKVKSQTMRAGLCRDGHYLGMRPVKLPNRLLLWPADAVERLVRGEVLK